jgi:hypothetical protein
MATINAYEVISTQGFETWYMVRFRGSMLCLRSHAEALELAENLNSMSAAVAAA